MKIEEKDIWKDYYLTNNIANIIKLDDTIEEIEINEFLNQCKEYKEVFEEEYLEYFRNEEYIYKQEDIVEKVLNASGIVGIVQMIWLNLFGLFIMGVAGGLSLLERKALRKKKKKIQDYNDMLDQDIRRYKINEIIEETKEQIDQMNKLKI